MQHQSLQLIVSFDYFHGLLVETRSFCTLKRDEDLAHLSIGPYVNLCNETSIHSKWYANHGWRWAWTKPMAVLRFALDYAKQHKHEADLPPHYVYYIDGRRRSKSHR